jgi:hypothetical protein
MTVTGITSNPPNSALPASPTQTEETTAATPAAPNTSANMRRNVAGTIPKTNVTTMMSEATMESDCDLN